MLPSSKDTQKVSQIGGSVLGVIIGTGLLVYAQGITQPDGFSKFLIYIAPTLAIFGDKVSAFIWARIVTGINNKELERQRALIKSERAEIADYLKNTETSKTHKDSLRRKMENLEFQSINLWDNLQLNPVLTDHQNSGNSQKPLRTKQKAMSI